MRYARMIGVAALATMALMAGVASSASASAKVCSTAGAGAACGAGHGKSYTGTIKASLAAGNSATLQATEGASTKFTCTTSEAEGTVNGETGTGSITKLSFGSCSSPFCFGTTTVTTTASKEKPWSATATTTIAGTNNGNGILDLTGEGQNWLCSFPSTSCTYAAVGTSQAHLTGSDTAPHLTATNVPLAWNGVGSTSICGHKGDWSGTYKVTTPSSLWIE